MENYSRQDFSFAGDILKKQPKHTVCFMRGTSYHLPLNIHNANKHMIIENFFIVKNDLNFLNSPPPQKKDNATKKGFTNYQKKIYILVIKRN